MRRVYYVGIAVLLSSVILLYTTNTETKSVTVALFGIFQTVKLARISKLCYRGNVNYQDYNREIIKAVICYSEIKFITNIIGNGQIKKNYILLQKGVKLFYGKYIR